MTSTILKKIEDHVLIITLNRPKQKNAFNTEMIEAWVESLEEAQRDDNVHVVVITGEGDAFCSGGDVKTMNNGKISPLDHKERLW